MASRVDTSSRDSQADLNTFIARFTPEVASLAHSVRRKLRARLPGAVELVYDNYNALAIGYGPSERASEAALSVVLYPRWVSLFFLAGVLLPDPKGLLRGQGKVVRHLVIGAAADLDRPSIRALIRAALAEAGMHPRAGQPIRTVIRSVSKKQRPRRPREMNTVV